jgi:hypothetical protein
LVPVRSSVQAKPVGQGALVQSCVQKLPVCCALETQRPPPWQSELNEQARQSVSDGVPAPAPAPPSVPVVPPSPPLPTMQRPVFALQTLPEGQLLATVQPAAQVFVTVSQMESGGEHSVSKLQGEPIRPPSEPASPLPSPGLGACPPHAAREAPSNAATRAELKICDIDDPGRAEERCGGAT